MQLHCSLNPTPTDARTHLTDAHAHGCARALFAPLSVTVAVSANHCRVYSTESFSYRGGSGIVRMTCRFVGDRANKRHDGPPSLISLPAPSHRPSALSGQRAHRTRTGHGRGAARRAPLLGTAAFDPCTQGTCLRFARHHCHHRNLGRFGVSGCLSACVRPTDQNAAPPGTGRAPLTSPHAHSLCATRSCR